ELSEGSAPASEEGGREGGREGMVDECRAEQCLFCAFAHLARLHPQRLAVVQPLKEQRLEERKEHRADTKASENEKWEGGNGGEGKEEGFGHGCTARKSKSVAWKRQTHSGVCASKDEEGDSLLKFMSSSQPPMGIMNRDAEGEHHLGHQQQQ
ncbi:hypothetical protein GOP47_0001192, partial [Adiantum capillus-veneris]